LSISRTSFTLREFVPETEQFIKQNSNEKLAASIRVHIRTVRKVIPEHFAGWILSLNSVGRG